ncbi:hypothetical protein, partial [Mycobacterium persicum]|uniref:hypothetical protein n=1 Tax=Mycobacterium persicum TaxID=1487726 RepID=UPI000AB18593
MLTGAALHTPVTTAPNSTATVQPLAYVHPEPRPSGASVASPPPLFDPGDAAHTLNLSLINNTEPTRPYENTYA